MNPNNGRFIHRDELYLMGVINPKGARMLTINHWIQIQLGMAQHVVMMAFFCHSLAQRRADLPIKFPNHLEYLSAHHLADAIAEYLDSLTNRPKVLTSATDSDITRVISILRKKFVKARMNFYLINTGPGNRGYRLEVPPGNLRLHFVDPDTGFVTDVPWDTDRTNSRDGREEIA